MLMLKDLCQAFSPTDAEYDRKAALFIKINIIEEKGIQKIKGTHKYRAEYGFSEVEMHLVLILNSFALW